MFFLLAIISMLGYSIHGTLMVKHARQIDGLSLSVYRNLSLGITMLPIFFSVDIADFQALKNVWHLVCIGSSLGIIGLAWNFTAQKSLPVGIHGALFKVRILLIFLWSYLFLGETISLAEMAAVLVVFGGVVFLTLQDNHMSHLDGKTVKGIVLVFIAALITSFAIFSISVASRQANPLLVVYFWEFLAGIFAFLIALGRSCWTGQTIQKISFSQLRTVVSISSLTLIGSGAFGLAVTYGSIGITNTIISSGIIVSAVLSYFLYGEKLNGKQWVGIIVILGGIMALKLTAA